MQHYLCHQSLCHVVVIVIAIAIIIMLQHKETSTGTKTRPYVSCVCNRSLIPPPLGYTQQKNFPECCHWSTAALQEHSQHTSHNERLEFCQVRSGNTKKPSGLVPTAWVPQALKMPINKPESLNQQDQRTASDCIDSKVWIAQKCENVPRDRRLVYEQKLQASK